MSPFQLLQIAPDADEREVKRAYARLLKRSRPDEDAAAFQRLQEAYAHCLDIVRMRATCATIDDDAVDGEAPAIAPEPMDRGDERWSRPPVAPDAVPEPAVAEADDGIDGWMPQEQHFDVAAFVASLHELLEQPDPARLQNWLYAQEALYSVYLKQVLRPTVVHAIEEAPRIRDSRVLEVLLAFFGLDRLDNDGLAERVQASLDRRYRGDRLDDIVRNLDSPGEAWLDPRIAAELAGQQSGLRRLLLLLMPTIPSQIRSLLERLRDIDPALRHRKLDPGAVAFWSQASDPFALNRPRLVMIALRVMALSAVIFGLMALVVGRQFPDAARTAGIWAAASAGLWGAWALCKWLWFHGARWAIQRLGLAPNEYDAIFSSLLGAALSWALGQNPFPILIGAIRGHILMIRPMDGLPGIASILMALAGAVVWTMLTQRLDGRIDIDMRATLILTLTLVPLLLTPLLRSWSPSTLRLSPWLAAQMLVTALLFGAAMLFL